jgi:putative transposase
MRSSSARVRAPEGDGCVAHAIRALREQLLWMRSFEAIEKVRLALMEWAELYNEHWLIEPHGLKLLAQRRRKRYAHTQQVAA